MHMGCRPDDPIAMTAMLCRRGVIYGEYSVGADFCRHHHVMFLSGGIVDDGFAESSVRLLKQDMFVS